MIYTQVRTVSLKSNWTNQCHREQGNWNTTENCFQSTYHSFCIVLVHWDSKKFSPTLPLWLGYPTYINPKSVPKAWRKRSFLGFTVQLVANWSISPLLSTAVEVLAPADSAFGLTLTVQEISMKTKFELGASKMQALGNISLLLLMSLPKTLSVVIYQSSFAFGILDLASSVIFNWCWRH